MMALSPDEPLNTDTEIAQMEAVDPPTLKFSEEHIEPILAGRKTSTIRLDGPDISIGERFQLLDEDGERFASAPLCDAGWESIEWIVKLGIEGHRNYRSVEHCINEMSEYYPDADLGPETCLDIYYWNWDELWE